MRKILCSLLLCLIGLEAARAEMLTGLEVSFRSKDGSADATALPNVWLYVPENSPPTPFLPASAFSAEWRGFVSADLRGDYSFAADLSGALMLEINGQTVLQAAGTGGQCEASKSIRLNKGTNSLRVRFESPSKGDAALRLYWIPKGSFAAPLPLAALSHAPGSASTAGARLRRGRELFVELRCQKCHLENARGMPELDMDAPAFEGIGERRQGGWMAEWILNPKRLRASAHMPAIFSGGEAAENAQAAAAYLSSLRAHPLPGPSGGDPEAGKQLFEKLHCEACHGAPNVEPKDPALIPLFQAARKFLPGALPEFLKNPAAHYAWTRMPRFKLTNAEPADLAAYLLGAPLERATGENPFEKSAMERGRELVQTSGCLNCHKGPFENKFKSPAPLGRELPERGCLAQTRAPGSRSPVYALTSEDREALRAFAAADRASLGRHVASEFAERQSRSLRCAECHGKFDGFPPFEILGDKLRPEWMAAFMSGKIDQKPRPWLEARMPSFGVRSEELAKGLSMLHGFPPMTAPEAAPDPEAAEVGRKLVSPVGGFSCILCHSVGQLAAAQIFESAGINFALVHQRLQKSYFERWLRNPLAIDPATKMPVYFQEDGQSPLPDIYGGDGIKQIRAIWEYFKLEDKMPAPPLN